MKLTPEKKIIKAKTKLLEKSPFYSFIIMNMVCQKHESEDLPTLAVNEYGHLFYNPKFVDELRMDELMAVLAHEAGHVATLTFQRKKGRNHTLWNIATDIVINYLLGLDGFTLPKGVLIPDHDGDIRLKELGFQINVSNLCAEEVYDALYRTPEVQKQMKQQQEFEQKIEDMLNNGGFSDKHIDGNRDPSGRECDDGGDEDSDGTSDQNGNQKNQNGGSGSQSQQNGQKKKKHGSGGMSKEKNAKKWRQILHKAILGSKTRGNSKVNDAYARELGMITESGIPWRALLERFITASLPADYTMRRPGRKSQGCGCYLPYLVREGLDVIIGVDMSGSISEEDWTAFMSEIIAITKGFAQINVKLIPWASQVEEKDIADFTRQNIDQLKDWRSDCCGGTTLSCFAEYLENNISSPNAINIIFTDGYVESDYKLPKGKTLVVLTNTEQMSMFKDRVETICLQN